VDDDDDDFDANNDSDDDHDDDANGCWFDGEERGLRILLIERENEKREIKNIIGVYWESC